MPARADPSDPLTWLERATGDLQIAGLGSTDAGIFLEDLCFHAQQAAEKALKAVCISRGLDFPRTHSLVLLIDMLATSRLAIPAQVREADTLTHYAVQARYPGWSEPVSEAEYREAVELARGVVGWARQLLGQEEP
jgi:HEPN domain-containing protein